MLRHDSPLLRRPARVLVAGISGAGKTTLAGRVAARLDVPHVEIDGLFHGPGWIPREAFVSDVRAFVARDAWVTEWQYAPVRTLLVERAELLRGPRDGGVHLRGVRDVPRQREHAPGRIRAEVE